MTRQVMAALTDPKVKNKMQMISKICDNNNGSIGAKKAKPAGPSDHHQQTSIKSDTLAQYLL